MGRLNEMFLLLYATAYADIIVAGSVGRLNEMFLIMAGGRVGQSTNLSSLRSRRLADRD